MSAIAIDDAEAGPIEVIQVLIALHPGFGAQELVGPVEVLSSACHKLKDPSQPALPPFSLPAPPPPFPTTLADPLRVYKQTDGISLTLFFGKALHSTSRY